MKNVLFMVALIAATSASAQITISDFSTAPGGADFSGGVGTWNNGAADQFTTSAGVLSITSVSSGNPDSTGYFAFADLQGGGSINAVALNLTQLIVTARIDVGNVATGGVSVIFYDGDGSGTEALYGTFANDGVSIGSFTSGGFTTQTITLIAHPAGGNAANIRYFGISGAGPTANFRMSFDSIVVSAVPEPSTYAMIAGVLALGFVAWRRRSVSA